MIFRRSPLHLPLDLREPTRLGAQAIIRHLDPEQDDRPWFFLRGTFQCWGIAHDLIGHDDIEGCGAGGGVQGLALAWAAQTEWHRIEDGLELRVHLLFSRRIHAPAEPLLPRPSVAAELWSDLPYRGRVIVTARP